jgi:hypothetical protein
LRIKSDATAKTETRVIEISRIAFWANEAAPINNLDDSGSTVVADLVPVLCDGAASATSTNRRIRRDRRRRVERFSATTIELASDRHFADVVLSMAM